MISRFKIQLTIVSFTSGTPRQPIAALHLKIIDLGTIEDDDERAARHLSAGYIEVIICQHDSMQAIAGGDQLCHDFTACVAIGCCISQT